MCVGVCMCASLLLMYTVWQCGGETALERQNGAVLRCQWLGFVCARVLVCRIACVMLASGMHGVYDREEGVLPNGVHNVQAWFLHILMKSGTVICSQPEPRVRQGCATMQSVLLTRLLLAPGHSVLEQHMMPAPVSICWVDARAAWMRTDWTEGD